MTDLEQNLDKEEFKEILENWDYEVNEREHYIEVYSENGKTRFEITYDDPKEVYFYTTIVNGEFDSTRIVVRYEGYRVLLWKKGKMWMSRL